MMVDQDRLAEQLKGLGYEGPLHVEQFPFGYSNLTFAITVGDRSLVLRRPPVGSKVKSAHDMSREYRIIEGLYPVFGRVPRPIAYFEADNYYLMERVNGTILMDQMPKDAEPRALSEAAVDTLVAIHAVDIHATGLAVFQRGDDYVARQVSGWTDRYLKSHTDDVPELEKTAAWLAEHLPTSAGACLIHNDYKYDNLVLNPSRLSDIRAVLDWEMATVGDPLMDLGTSLGYWAEAGDPPEVRALPFSLTATPGSLSRADMIQRYAARSGRAVDQPGFYYAYGLFKIAVVAQQIYFRYKQGLTQDPRFAHLMTAIRILSSRSWNVCQSGRC